MTDTARLPVVLMWHMHQPQYRDALTGQYVLPWTYMHAIKDYVDMAAHLEDAPFACAVVNFTPVLIEQLEEIAARIASMDVPEDKSESTAAQQSLPADGPATVQAKTMSSPGEFNLDFDLNVKGPTNATRDAFFVGNKALPPLPQKMSNILARR